MSGTIKGSNIRTRKHRGYLKRLTDNKYFTKGDYYRYYLVVGYPNQINIYNDKGALHKMPKRLSRMGSHHWGVVSQEEVEELGLELGFELEFDSKEDLNNIIKSVSETIRRPITKKEIKEKEIAARYGDIGECLGRVEHLLPDRKKYYTVGEIYSYFEDFSGKGLVCIVDDNESVRLLSKASIENNWNKQYWRILEDRENGLEDSKGIEGKKETKEPIKHKQIEKGNTTMKIQTNVTLVDGSEISNIPVEALKEYMRDLIEEKKHCQEFLSMTNEISVAHPSTSSDSYSTREVDQLTKYFEILQRELNTRDLEEVSLSNRQS